MRYAVPALALMGALFLVGPAAAQIVNGHNDVQNPLPEAPIGTKAGGDSASMQAPGEAQAAAGAIKNNEDAKNLQPTPDHPVVVGRKAPDDTTNDTTNYTANEGR